MTERRRGSTMRSIALFVAGMLAMGAFALVPAAAHIGGTTKHLQKHLDKRYLRGARFGPVSLMVGSPEVKVAKMGPFTWFAGCDQEAGVDTDVRAYVRIATSRNDSALDAQDYDPDFDIADNENPTLWARQQDNPPGGSTDLGWDESQVASTNGFVIWGITSFQTNYAGSHCRVSGFLTRIAR